MRFRVVSGSDLVTGRERVVRCGAWGRSGPRARLGGGRCGAFLRRRARRIPSTRQGSSRPGTLPPCAPPGRGAVQESGDWFLGRAVEAGVARPGLSFDDVLRLVASITMVDVVDSGQRDRILRLALDGLRYQSSDA